MPNNRFNPPPKEADIPEGVFQTYKSSIVDANPLAMDLIQKGYAEE